MPAPAYSRRLFPNLRQRKLRDPALVIPKHTQRYELETALDDYFYRSRSDLRIQTRDVFPEFSQVNISWLENVTWDPITHSGLYEPSMP